MELAKNVSKFQSFQKSFSGLAPPGPAAPGELIPPPRPLAAF